MALAAERHRPLAHALEYPLPDANRAGEEHLVMHLEKLLFGQAEGLDRFFGDRHGVCLSAGESLLNEYVIER